MNTLSLNNLHTEISSHLHYWNIPGFFLDYVWEFKFEIGLSIILIILVIEGILMCSGSSSDPVDLTGDSPPKGSELDPIDLTGDSPPKGKKRKQSPSNTVDSSKKNKLSLSLKEEIDEIIQKLYIQSLVNTIRFSNNQSQIPYLRFPPGHPGHFTQQNCYRLYSMVASSEKRIGVYRPGLNAIIYYETFGIINYIEVPASPLLIEIAEDAKKRGL